MFSGSDRPRKSCMQTLYKNQKTQSSGFAKKNDLERISFSILERRNPKIDNKSNILLSCFVALSKLGKIGISSPIYHILKMINRSGFNISERSLYRALNSLQLEGIINRNRYRVGDDRFCTVIVFNDDAFSYWTGKKSQKVIPVNTCSIISDENSQLPKRQEVDRTKTDHRVNTPNNYNKYTKQRAGARDQYIQHRGGVEKDPTPKGSRKRRNAILYTIAICLDKMRSVHRSDRKRALSRARSEIYGNDAGVEFVNPTGIDWRYWSDRWSEFSIPVRESTAMREILPFLLGRSAEQEQLIEITEQNTVQQSEVDKIKRYLSKEITIKEDINNNIVKYPTVDESDPEMAILVSARNKIRSGYM